MKAIGRQNPTAATGILVPRTGQPPMDRDGWHGWIEKTTRPG